MRSRGLVVALALLLAIGATAAVFLYVNGVREDAKTGGDLVTVVVANQDIQANAELDPLLESGGVFTTAQVTPETLVDGAVTSSEQLAGQTTTFPILANEQIPVSRLSSGEGVTGGSLGISPGHIGTAFRVDGPPGVGGHVVRGDNVVVYATFSGVKVFKSFKELVNDATSANPNAAAPAQAQESLPALTVTLVPTAKVLDVENPTETADGKTSEGQVTLTLDLLPEDSANMVYAAERGSLWFGLLPPGEEGVQLPAASLPIDKVLGKKA
jgi:Flp pilus assembly protein CpaB